ncbi:MAG: VWA domain-containing protein [bacterium]|nr:VWA domain-containing protein [bacterium]
MRLLLASSLATTLVLAAPRALAGDGTFLNGEFNFCVSVRFNASPTELDRIKDQFVAASQLLADATDSQHRFGTVTIVNDSGASRSAEFWVHAGTGRANAHAGGYGKRGWRSNLYLDADFSTDPMVAVGGTYTIIHEFAHLAYGVRDEYCGPSTAECTNPTYDEECAAPPGSTSLDYCLMDTFFRRGGRTGNPPTFTMNEFCVPSLHDPDEDTVQEKVHGKSCWETIHNHPKWPATMPAGLPTSDPPSMHAVTTRDGRGGLRAMILIDCTTSMNDDDKLDFAKQGAKAFVDFVDEGTFIGVACYTTGTTIAYPLTEMASPTLRAAAKAAIDGLSAGGQGDIGGALLTCKNQFVLQSDRSCDEIIVFLSDGDHDGGTAPTLAIPELNAESVSVFSLGIGPGISAVGIGELAHLANATGGTYFWIFKPYDVIRLIHYLVRESVGNGILVNAPEQVGSSEMLERTVLVETGATSLEVSIALENDQDDIALSLRDPGGMLVTEATSMTDPDVDYFDDDNHRTFLVRNPIPGDWTLIATSGAVTAGSFRILASAGHDGVALAVATVDAEQVYPDPVRIEASLTFDGLSVFGASVDGVVVRPDGVRYPITLFDDGFSMHGDDVDDDGIYSALFDAYSIDGTYTIEVTAEALLASIHPGESLDGPPAGIDPAPPFVRHGTGSVVVSGVPTPAPVGVNYCPNNANSTGLAGTIAATGSDLVADNDLTLTASNLPVDVFGYFLVNTSEGFLDLPAAGFSHGFFCLGGGDELGRYAQLVQSSGPTGMFSIPVDLTAVPSASDPVPTVVEPGQTFYFQGWYRDADAGAPENNFTDAVRVLFL